MEALKHWQRLKVYRILLARYLEKGKIEVVYREIESLTRIQLKMIFRWLISKSQLKDCVKSDTMRRSTIVIIMGISKKVVKLFSKKLRFGGVFKVVEKY